MKPNIVSFGLQYRRIVMLIAVVLIAWGVYSLVDMDKNEFPSFTIREGVVAAVYPGADAAEVEQKVLKPIQDYVFSFKEVNKEKTTAQVSDGMVMIFVTLDDNVGKAETDRFWNKFKLGVDNVKASLPAGVLAVQTISDFGNTSALLLTMQGKDKTYRELHDYMEQLRDRLRAVPGIGTMTVYGEQTEQIGVHINTERLKHYGIDEKTLALTLFAQGFQTTGGRLKSDACTMPVYVAESFNSVNDVKQTVVLSIPAGDVVRLCDIAEVVREYPEPTSYITNNGEKCLLLSVEMKDGENIVAMGKAAGKVIDEFAEDMPVDMELFKITDQPMVVNLSVLDFLKELLIAIVAVLVVIMLLLPLKVAVIAALTIPVSIFISLGLFHAFGIELNTVTLACLIVSLGMIVDNSVVIIDEYVDLISDGMPHMQASVKAGTMFFRAIVSATLAISITFFPFLITMTGMFRDFLTFFPWAILLILTISLVVAEMIVPYLQYKIIKKPIYAIEKQAIESGKKKFSFFVSLQKWYDKLAALCFAWPKTSIAAGLVSVLLGLWAFSTRPIQLMPIAERDQFAVEIYLPAGSSLHATDVIADSLAAILRKDERVVSVASFHGMSSPRFQTTYAPQVGGPEYAQFIVNTKSNEATIEMLNEYTPVYQDYFPGAYVKFKQLSYSNAKYPVEVRLSGHDYKHNMKAADTVMSVMRRIPGLTLVRPAAGSQLVAATVEPDFARMSRLGLNNTLLETTLAMRYGPGVPMGTLWEGDYGIDIIAKTQNTDSSTYAALMSEPIPVMGVGSTPLKAFADVKPTCHPGRIDYRGGIPAAIIAADNVRGENTIEQTSILQKELDKIDLPDGVTLSYGGDYEQAEEIMPQICGALIIAVVIIFFILLLHYKGVVVPLLMLFSLVFIIPGAGIGLAVMDDVISLTCVLGLVSLMGILVRNVIIMFDYAEELQGGGMSVKDSIYQACERRMRPIFLTSAAATMGVLPMVLSGSALWKPMGIVIFFGTPVTMLLILTVIPILYWKFCKKESTTVESAMKSNQIITSIIFAALSALPVAAENFTPGDTLTLSLEQCREMALRENAAAKTAVNNVKIAKATADEAFTKYFPEISASGMSLWANHDIIQYNVMNMFELGMVKKGVVAGVTAMQPIFAGGQIVNGNALAHIGEQVAELRKRQTDDEVYASVDKYYWKLVYLHSQKETLASLITMLDTIANQTRVAVDAGVTLKNDLLKVELQRNDFKATMIDLDNGIALCSNLLGQYIGVGPAQVNVTERIVPGEMPEFARGLWRNPQEAVMDTPAYGLLNSAVKAAELDKKMTIGRNLLTVGLGAGWFYHNLLEQDRNFGAVFISVNIPLTGWWGGSHAIKKKNLAIHNARIQFEDGREMLRIAMLDAWDNLTAAYRKMETASESICQAEEYLRLSENYYSAGVSSITDLLEAQTLYEKACNQYISAYSDYQVKSTEYLKAAGRLTR